MYRIIHITLIGLFCFFSLTLKAQTTLNVSGAVVSNNSNSITYSVGQVFLQTEKNDSYILTEGVLQIYEVFEVDIPTSTLDLEKELEMNAFPNPVSHFLTLKTPSSESLSVSLHNLQGKELYKIDQFKYTTRLPLEDQPTGIYLVQVYHEATIVKTFKIIKN